MSSSSDSEDDAQKLIHTLEDSEEIIEKRPKPEESVKNPEIDESEEKEEKKNEQTNKTLILPQFSDDEILGADDFKMRVSAFAEEDQRPPINFPRWRESARESEKLGNFEFERKAFIEKCYQALDNI